MMDAHANQHLQEKLSSLGASVYRYMSVTNCHFRAKETALRPKISEYVKFNMGPTTTWTVNSALDYAKQGFDGIVHVKSFGCTPEIDAVPVLQNISRDFHIPVLYLSYDTQNSDTGLDTKAGSILRYVGKKEEGTAMKKKAYLGIDIGSISTKGVIINENNDFLAESYLWTEGIPQRLLRKY